MPNNQVNLNTLIGEMSGLVGDATTGGSTEQNRKILALNFAKNTILSQTGLPGAEVTYSFLYTENVYAYPIPFGYIDKIMLRYNQSAGNYNNNERANWSRKFEYVNPQEFYTLQYAQAYDIVYWSVDYVNGSPCILINTRNIVSKFIIDQADSTENWSLLGDGSNLRVDNFVYTSGLGSLEFDIDAITHGFTTIQKNLVNSPYDWTVYDENGTVTFDIYLQGVTGLTGISGNWGSDLTDYWTQTVTVNSNGGVLVDGWNSISIQWTNTTMVGDPDVSNIQFFWVTLMYGNTLVPATDWRIDNFNLYSPDGMVFTFYTDQTIGVQGSTTNTSNIFVNPTDVALFITTDISVKDTLEAWAAMIYKPVAVDEDNSWLQTMATSGLKTLQNRYPKKVVTYIARTHYDTNRMHGRHGRRGR